MCTFYNNQDSIHTEPCYSTDSPRRSSSWSPYSSNESGSFSLCGVVRGAGAGWCLASRGAAVEVPSS